MDTIQMKIAIISMCMTPTLLSGEASYSLI